MKIKSKKFRILFYAGITVAALALIGWLLFRLHFSWLSMEKNLPYPLTHNKEEQTVVLDFLGICDIVFDLNEPAFQVAGERIAMRDGVRIRNGKPYINLRDALSFSEQFNNAMDAVSEADPTERVGVIVNGLFGQGTQEENEMINSLLGEHAKSHFELYFQWYNTIHELGHLITMSHNTYDSDDMSIRHMVDEEQLVNSFAVAFWIRYGEEEKINALEEMVDYVLSNITPPTNNMSPVDFMRNAIDKGKMTEVFTFETYGWFQFSLVRDILRERENLDLTALLEQMTNGNVTEQPRQTLVYPALGTDMVPVIVGDVISQLRDWGVVLPDVYIAFSADPNQHSLQRFPRSVLRQNIEAGRILPAVVN